MTTLPLLLEADDRLLAPSDDLAVALEAVRGADVHPDAEVHRDRILRFGAQHPDALRRSCRLGHLTGSALVVAPDAGAVVLLHHRKLRRWLQPGGHCDGAARLAAVALREATEETGIRGLRVHPVAVDLDVHEVAPPGEEPHVHLDVRFLVVAPDTRPPPGNHESTAIRWVPLAETGTVVLDEGIHRMIEVGTGLVGRGADRPGER